MESYTVKQLAAILKTNEETVRRWIRSGKLEATWTSKKKGNVISSVALNKFIKETPKYANAVATAFVNSPIAMSVIIGGLLGSMFALMEGTKNRFVTTSDVESFLTKKVATHEKNLNIKRAELEKIQKEIDIEQQELTKYKYALENLDLNLVANAINNEKK